MSMWTVILKNSSGGSVTVEDLGVVIADLAQITASDQFTFDELAGSDSLRVLIDAGTLVVNDGTNDLSAADGVKLLTFEHVKDLEDNYYNKTELESDGTSAIHWNNITNAPSFGSPSWLSAVKYRVLGVELATAPLSPTIGNVYVSDADTYYKWDGAVWNSLGLAADGDRIIDLADASQNIKEITTGVWAIVDNPLADNSGLVVDDDGDGGQAQYAYNTTTAVWSKIGDVDFGPHLDGGASKHDASEIDVEGTGYSYISAGDLETAIDAIDTQMGVNASAAATAQTAADTAQTAADAAQTDINTHLDGGVSKHDASEIDVEGTGYTYVSVGDLETAISAIDAELVSQDARLDTLEAQDIVTSLDAAYDDGASGAGRVITVDAGPVKLDASSGTDAPLELTNLAAAPTTNLAAGQLAPINGLLCQYDAVRSKWLSVERFVIMFGRGGQTKNQYLNFGVGSLTSNNSGARMLRNACIIGISGQLDAAGSCSMHIQKNDVSGTNIATLALALVAGGQATDLNVDLTAGEYLQAYLEAVSNVKDPVMLVEIAWRP